MRVVVQGCAAAAWRQGIGFIKAGRLGLSGWRQPHPCPVLTATAALKHGMFPAANRLGRAILFAVVILNFLIIRQAEAASVDNATLKLEYSEDAKQPLRLVNKFTGHPLALNTAAPALEFKEGLIGGRQVQASRIGQQTVLGGTEILLEYPPQKSGKTEAQITTHFFIPDHGNFIRKYVTVNFQGAAGTELTLLKVVLLDEALFDKVSYSHSGWQSHPIFTDELFFGVEFPVANATASQNRIVLSHMPGKVLNVSQPYRSRDAVIGVCQPGQVREAFVDYVASFRPQSRVNFNYNSWWTSSVPFTEAEILGLIQKFETNLYQPNGVSFDSFTIDLGWSARNGIWQIDPKLFPQGFASLQQALARSRSRLGIWWSPGNFYSPSSFDNDWAAEAGYETYRLSGAGGQAGIRLMCLAGPRYQAEARKSLVAIATANQLGQMKFDGYGMQCPATNHGHLPDELSRERIAEGVIDIFSSLRQAQPDLWLEPTCFGADGSPWWLRYSDSVTGLFGDDAPPGVIPAPIYRESYTTSRDFFNLHSVLYPMPIAAQEVLGIVHQSSDPFFNDAVVTVLRGHQFISLYLNPKYLQAADYKFLAELMTWARANQELLSRTRIILPREWQEKGVTPIETDLYKMAAMPRQTYGYAHWNKGAGLLCLRNPWIAMDEASIQLDEKTIGATEHFSGYAAYQVYPYPACLAQGLKSGDTLKVTVGPYQTRVIRFIKDSGFTVTPDPCVTQSADLKILDAKTKLFEVVSEGGLKDVSGDRQTVLPTSQGILWQTTINGQSRVADAKLYYLIESTNTLAQCEAEITIDGKHVAANPLSSDGGWSATQPVLHQNHWVWFVVPVPAGKWEAQADLRFANSQAKSSAWLVNAVPVSIPESNSASRPPPFPLPPTLQLRASVNVFALTEIAAAAKETIRQPARIIKINGLYLDRLEPVSAEQGFGKLQKNQSVWEKPLRIGSRHFLRGIGTHANGKISYNLDGKFQTFHGFAGPDSATSGTLTLEVWVDGVKRWETGVMKGGEEAREFHVPVRNAKTLTLIVTDAGNGIMADHADFADAWLEE